MRELEFVKLQHTLASQSKNSPGAHLGIPTVQTGLDSSSQLILTSLQQHTLKLQSPIGLPSGEQVQALPHVTPIGLGIQLGQVLHNRFPFTKLQHFFVKQL